MKKFLKTIMLTICILSLLCQISLSMTLGEPEHTNKVVYLTFDDGPGGKVTSKVLDILKENDVKASFFLIGDQCVDQADLVKRIYDDGHAIGLHTFTHKKNKIYSSELSFLEENLKAQHTIEEITGFKPTILRFPFGSSNGSYKLTTSMVKLLHENGLKIYDWNVDSTDGMNPKMQPYRIAEKASSKESNAIVLMHCGTVNKNSAEALPQVIKYYKDNGYEFKTLDDTTPEIYRIKKKN